MKSPDVWKGWSKSWIVMIGLAFVPLFSFAQQTTDCSETVHVRMDNEDNHRKLQWRRNGVSFNVEFDGYVTLSDDDRDVVAISAGGYLKISKSAFGSKRRILIEADRDGNLIRKYYEGWSQKDYEPDGRNWLAEVLPEIVRSSTLGAEDRVNRIYDRGGMSAFVNEVERLEGDYVKTAYIKIIICKKLTDDELDQLISVMGREVKSDYYLSSLLMDNYSVFLANPNRVTAFVGATRSIGSDHYMAELLQKVLVSDEVSDTQLSSVLKAAESIQSDHYLSNVLIELMNRRELSGATLEDVMDVSRGIQSDHYLSQTLREALNQDNLSGSTLNAILGPLDEIQSDHYTKEVILAMGDADMSSATMVTMLGILQREIQSDHYLGEALRHIMREQELEGETYSAFVRAAASISSDNYSSEVFRQFAQEKTLNEDQLVQLLNATGNIQSDHYLSQVLVALAPQVTREGEVAFSAYRNAAKQINSETYYGRAMRAID